MDLHVIFTSRLYMLLLYELPMIQHTWSYLNFACMNHHAFTVLLIRIDHDVELTSLLTSKNPR